MARYLILSNITIDAGGRSMIDGFTQGIQEFDSHAHIMCLYHPDFHKPGTYNYFREPDEYEAAFSWADCAIDLGGLFNRQPNRYEHMVWAQKLNKPIVYGSQSFQTVDKAVLTVPNTKVVARGQRAANKLTNAGIPVTAIAPDLSFLIKPEDVFISKKSLLYLTSKRIFSTHFTKKYNLMYELADPETDLQIIEKLPNGEIVYEPEIPNIKHFHGEPAQHFGLVAQAEEIHTARYQIACAAILAGKKPIIYGTGDDNYDSKYEDLMDLYGKSAKELRDGALVSCELAAEAANGG